MDRTQRDAVLRRTKLGVAEDGFQIELPESLSVDEGLRGGDMRGVGVNWDERERGGEAA
jgi:hypothetical protein